MNKQLMSACDDGNLVLVTMLIKLLQEDPRVKECYGS